MSKKSAAAEQKDNGAKREPKPKMQVPSGPAPTAKVSTKDLEGKSRSGRGFSMQELKEASVSPGMAKKLGLYVDQRRSTKRDENVSALKSWLK